MKGSDLAMEVLELIDTKAVRVEDGADPTEPTKKLWRLKYNRQWVARWLTQHGRTCLGGYTLTGTKVGTGKRPVAHYTLTKEKDSDETAPRGHRPCMSGMSGMPSPMRTYKKK